MPAGRPAKSNRTAFGQRLLLARQNAGFSQIQLAEKLGITQQSYAGWERRETALKPEHLARLSELLNVPAHHLLGQQTGRNSRNSGPAGRAKRAFEAVSKLSRSEQKKILDVVEALLAQHRAA